MENLNILHYVTNIIYTYTIYLLMTTFQKKESEYSKNIQMISYALFYLVVTTIFSFMNIPIITIFTNLICIFALSFLYSYDILKNMQISIVIYAILAIEEIMFTYVLNEPLKEIFKSEEHLSIMNIFFGNIILLLTAFLIKRFFKSKQEKISAIPQIYNVIISSATIVIVLIMTYNANVSAEIFAFISATLIFVNLFTLWGYEQISSALNEQFKVQSLKEKAKSYEKEIELMDEQIFTLRKYKHDAKSHLIAIEGFIKEKDEKNAISYIENLFDIYSEQENLIKTKNKIINSILNYKIKVINDNNIKLNTDIRMNGEIDIKDYDLSIILSNMIDNAIDAQLKIKEEERRINIKISDDKNKFTIKIENAYNGDIKEENGELISTKEDHKSHGIGIKKVKEIAEKNSGIFKIDYDENKFTAYFMIIMEKTK